MNKENGVLLFAKNNDRIDYIKQAVFLTKRIKKYMNIPVSIVTDSKGYLESKFDSSIFDTIITTDSDGNSNFRLFKDGTMSDHRANFKNSKRSHSYDLSPYNNTIVMDTDIIICNDTLKNSYKSKDNFLIYKDSVDLAAFRNQREFKYISESSIDFYWATVFFFKKTEENKIFFDLVKHIEENYNHYRRVYQINSTLFRNDFAFSIAIHIMNGFQKGDFSKSMPGKLYHILDRDILWNIDKEDLTFLIEKESHLGEYTALKTKSLNVHAMNKFSLAREIDKELADD